jgi:hypothetical protein
VSERCFLFDPILTKLDRILYLLAVYVPK